MLALHGFALAGLLLGVAAQAAPADALSSLEVAVAAAPAFTRPPFARERPAELVAIDGAGLSTDEQLTLLCLQGLVNRKAPRLYVVGFSDFNRKADLYWLERFRTEYGIASRDAAPWDALKEFAGDLHGYVIYSPAQPWTENVAAMLGSLLGWLPVCPQVAPRAEAAGLKLQANLEGLWPDRIAAYRWALDHLQPKLGGTDFGTISERSWLLIRDYLVMRGAFTTSLSCLPGPERDLKTEMMRRFPPGSIQWGWTPGNDDEGSYTRHASSCGHRTLCSTNSGNMSVFSQIRPRGTPRRQPPRRTLTPERKVYLSFVLTDGDSVPIDLTRQWYHWTDTARGKVAFGWEIQPLLAEIAPVVLESFYEEASPLDEFILGPSGAGYTNPSLMPNLSQFLRDTEAGLRATDSRVVGIIDDRKPEVEREFSRRLPSATGFFYGWGGSPEAQVGIVGGKPHCDYRVLLPETGGKEKGAAYYAAIARTVRDIARRDGLPCCIPVHLSCYWSGPDDVPKIVEAVQGHLPVEVVKPSELVSLMKQVYAERVTLAAPRTVQAVPGLSAVMPVTLRSTCRDEAVVGLSAHSPAGFALGLPAEVRVPAEGTVTVEGTLRAQANMGAGRPVAISLRAVRQGEASRAHVRVALVPAPGNMPAEAVIAQSVWETEDLAHNLGHRERDPAAHNGYAWVARPGDDSSKGCLVWGPYEPLQPGEYAVAFRVKTSGVGADAVVATLDVFDYIGGNATGVSTLAQGTVTGAGAAYHDVWLRFSVRQPLKAEYRVTWKGVGEISVDRVVVVRLRGNKPS